MTPNHDTIELPCPTARAHRSRWWAAGAPMVAEQVSAWFGSNKVLDQVDLSMPARTVTALIGPSGCGKSTFIRTLNRTHELVHKAALSGRVLLDGQDIYSPTTRPMEVRRRIGMVFQKPNPFPAMTIAENVLSARSSPA
jgi:phosphate transport system ATP-binding protein